MSRTWITPLILLIACTCSIASGEDVPTREQVVQRYEARRRAAVEAEVQRLQVLVDTFQHRLREYQRTTDDDRHTRREHAKSMTAERDAAVIRIAAINVSVPDDLSPVLNPLKMTLGDAGTPTPPIVQEAPEAVRKGRFVLSGVIPPDAVIVSVLAPVRYEGYGGAFDWRVASVGRFHVLQKGIAEKYMTPEGTVDHDLLDKTVVFDQPYYITIKQDQDGDHPITVIEPAPFLEPDTGASN